MPRSSVDPNRGQYGKSVSGKGKAAKSRVPVTESQAIVEKPGLSALEEVVSN